MVPKTILSHIMLGKVGKMTLLARTITNPRIPDKVFLLASLFSKWPQRQSLTRPRWEKLGKWWPLPGPLQIYIFLIRFFSWLNFSKMVPKTIPSQTMLGQVGKMMTLARTSTNPHIPHKVFLLASLFPKRSPSQSLPRPCWDKFQEWRPLTRPSQIHIFLIRFFSWLHFFRNCPQDNPLPDHVGKS